jgi:calcium-translocating P-type ATPase
VSTKTEIQSPETGTPYFTQSASGLLDTFSVCPDSGLLHDEALRRIRRDGPNALEQKRRISWLNILANQFKNLMVVILLAAVAIALLAWYLEGAHGFPGDAAIILAIVVANAGLGFFQEYGAEKAIEELQRAARTRTRALRGGEIVELPQESLVVGDIVVLSEGDKVPADCILLSSSGLRSNESLLTGESLPVDKEPGPVAAETPVDSRKCALHAGSTIVAGEARALVVATGSATFLGSIATSLSTTVSEPTPLERRLSALGRQIGWAVLVLTVVIASTILAIEGRLDPATLVRVAMFSVALAVAAVPEGLPAVLTVSLSAGARRLARRRALARKMSAVETLGSVTVIVTDKTGTLTHNQMTVRGLYAGEAVIEVSGEGLRAEGQLSQKNAASEALIECGVMANNASLEQTADGPKGLGDAMDAALLVLADKAGKSWRSMQTSCPVAAETPFSSERARMSQVRDLGPDRWIFCKGSVQSVLPLCDVYLGADGVARPLDQTAWQRFLDQETTFGRKALRTLALARRRIGSGEEGDLESHLELLGLAAFIDPPRAEVSEAIKTCGEAGIRVIMMTGDHPVTAQAIAHEVGLHLGSGGAETGARLSGMGDEEMTRAVAHCNVWARVTPDQKLKLVSALIEQGHVVAMTGDGVNDAPALKRVHVGVSMGQGGTAVAVEASDLVLTDDNFATIISAVEEGRSVFANIRRFMAFLFSGNLGVVMAMFLGALIAGLLSMRVGGELLLPLVAAQILWMNLMTDGAPAVAYALSRGTRELMREKPNDPSEPILTPHLWRLIGTSGVALCALFLLVLDLLYEGGLLTLASLSLLEARSAAFYTLVTARLANSLNYLHLQDSVLSATSWTNRYVPLAGMFSWLATLGLLYSPAAGLFGLAAPSWQLLALLTLVAIPAVLVPVELYKWACREGIKFEIRLGGGRRRPETQTGAA